MAHDVSEFIKFLGASKWPDQRVTTFLALTICAFVFPISYLFTKYHYINCYSYRFEVYAVKNGGYKKFREKMFRTHKTPGNWMGAYT